MEKLIKICDRASSLFFVNDIHMLFSSPGFYRSTCSIQNKYTILYYCNQSDQGRPLYYNYDNTTTLTSNSMLRLSIDFCYCYRGNPVVSSVLTTKRETTYWANGPKKQLEPFRKLIHNNNSMRSCTISIINDSFLTLAYNCTP